MAAFKDTIPIKASATRAGPIDANAPTSINALHQIARLLGRIAAKESVSGVHDEAAPHQCERTVQRRSKTATMAEFVAAEKCRHAAPCDSAEDD
jgi:hypothetical protein